MERGTRQTEIQKSWNAEEFNKIHENFNKKSGKYKRNIA